MEGFALSPGITPALTDIFVVELPIVLGAAYLLYGRRGFEVAFVFNTLLLGAIKLGTDLSDPWDDLVSVAALATSGAWLALLAGARISAGLRWWGCVLLGAAGVVLGVIKLRDFFDPFDILVADGAIVSGLALWVYRRRDPSGARATAPG